MPWPGCPEGGRRTAEEASCSGVLASPGGSAAEQARARPASLLPLHHCGQDTVFLRRIVVVLYLVQETARAQRDLVLETAQDQGRVEQAVLELRREFQAVSTGPAPFLGGCAADCH